MNRTRKPLSTHKQRSEQTEDGGFNRTNRPTNATSNGEGQRPRCCKADQRPPTPFEHRTQRRLPSPAAIPFLRSTRGRKRARGGPGPTPQDRSRATARGRPSAALAWQGGDQGPHDAAAKRKESWLHPGPNDRPPRHPLQSGARGPRPPALRSPQPTRAEPCRRPEGVPSRRSPERRPKHGVPRGVVGFRRHLARPATCTTGSGMASPRGETGPEPETKSRASTEPCDGAPSGGAPLAKPTDEGKDGQAQQRSDGGDGQHRGVGRPAAVVHLPATTFSNSMFRLRVVLPSCS